MVVEGLNTWVSSWGRVGTGGEMALLVQGQIFCQQKVEDELALVIADPMTREAVMVLEGSHAQLNNWVLGLYALLHPDWAADEASLPLDSGSGKHAGDDGAGLVGGEAPGDGLSDDAVEGIEQQGPTVDQLSA